MTNLKYVLNKIYVFLCLLLFAVGASWEPKPRRRLPEKRKKSDYNAFRQGVACQLYTLPSTGAPRYHLTAAQAIIGNWQYINSSG